MKKRSKPLEFLEKAQKDPKLSARVEAAVERGGKLTAEEVLQIAKEFGFSFTRGEFEREVKRDIAARFAAGEERLADVAGAKKPKAPPESSCAKGCLSYTKSWHPRREFLEASKKNKGEQVTAQVLRLGPMPHAVMRQSARDHELQRRETDPQYRGPRHSAMGSSGGSCLPGAAAWLSGGA